VNERHFIENDLNRIKRKDKLILPKRSSAQLKQMYDDCYNCLSATRDRYNQMKNIGLQTKNSEFEKDFRKYLIKTENIKKEIDLHKNIK
jgi:hypothetical protein